MTATMPLSAEQDLIRRALAVLEVGPVWDPDVPDDIHDVVDRSRPELLRDALADHDTGGCYVPGECHAAVTAQRVLALAGRQHDIVRMRKVIVAIVAIVDEDPNLPYGHVDDVLADRIAAAVLVHQAGAR